MELYIVDIAGEQKIWEVVFDETDGFWHVCDIGNEFVKWQPFKSKEAVLRKLDEYKAHGVIKEYRKY